MKKILKPLLAGVLVIFALAVSAQKTATYYHPTSVYQEALDLFEKEKYAAALRKFQEYEKIADEPQEELSVNARYYAGISSLYLFHKDAEYNLEQFILEYPESPWVQKIYFELATYNYKRRDYDDALEWFESVDHFGLEEEQLVEFYYKRGHSYFEEEQFSEARTDFYEVKDLESEYRAPATYYYSHIAYRDGDWETALQGFKWLSDDPNFAPVVPYYISQIYYLQGRYDKLLEYAPPLLDSAKIDVTERVPEIAQLIGDSYYRNDQFQQALPYFRLYHEETRKSDITRKDFYQLGYSFYQTGNYREALEQFSEVTRDEEDQLTQSAIYHMADCYLKLDEKPYARSAFKEASEMSFDMKIKEDALFNYAKLAFELSYNPFHEAITAFESYLEKYPDSPRRDEAYEFLLNVYMKTKSYDAALRSLDQIKNKDSRTREAYQVVSFNRGVQLFQSKKYPEAKPYFEQVSTYPINQALVAKSVYWLAEIAYEREKYSSAIADYKRFQSLPGSFSSEMYAEASYNTGYALFKQEKYIDASSAFRRFAESYNGSDKRKLNDAYLRIGDCYYVSKNYEQAIENYDLALNLENMPMKDYAMFQKAICYGLNGEIDKKLWILKNMVSNSPDSKYVVDAKFQLGQSYLEENRLEEALTYYNEILDEHPTSPYVKESLTDLALIYAKRDNNDKVLEIWDRIREDYPNDVVMKNVYPIVESILLEERGAGALQELEDFAVLDISKEEIDNSTFNKASDYYFDENCPEAIERLSDYLTRFQPAIHGVEAHFYLAECYFKRGQTEEALNAYNFVISQPVSDYTELALVSAATINYNKKNYQQALNHYQDLEGMAIQKDNILEAEIGQMRCYYKLGQFEYVKEYADKVINNEGTPEQIKNDALMMRAKTLYSQDQLDEAYGDFQQLAKKQNSRGAEAKYHMSLIAYQKQEYKAAETEVFELVQNFSAYNEFKYKGFLLLADIYIGLEDYFQAKTTLNTILENVSETWVVEEAQKKLKRVKELEEGTTGNGESQEGGELEIMLNDSLENGQGNRPPEQTEEQNENESEDE
jgi:TolA-binding protein